jgi:methylamine--corrinoid protein Co-methyltransferase
MAMAIVCGCILLQMTYMTPTHSVSPAHPFLGHNTMPQMMRAISVAQQALARNTRLLTDVVITPGGGLLTHSLLYEVAALAALATASGACGLIGPRSSLGTHSGCVSGLEARFMAEVAHAVEGMSRQDVDRIVQSMVARYSTEQQVPPQGKPFWEVYDLTTLKPIPEWAGMVEDVKQELVELGLPL